MKRIILSIAALILAVIMSAAADVSCIWDKAYSAFPSIVEFQGKYYVSFREGESHIFDSYGNAAGKARVLVSEDGEKWESVALVEKEGFDLRDPKLSVTPDGRLMLVMGGSIYVDQKLQNQIPQVSFSSDGKSFTEPQTIRFEGLVGPRHGWLWRVTWQDGVGYGVFYANPRECKHEADYALVKTTDASGKFDIVETLPSGGDTSYPGFIVVGDQLWMVYYSSHETGKAAIYLAKLPLSQL